MTRFEAYTLRRLLVPLISVGYVSVAICLKPETNVETFPFFNWSLFSITVANRSDAVVMVRMVDGRPVDPPRLFYEMTETFGAARRRDPSLHKALQRMARAFRAGDKAAVEVTRRVIEQTYMREVSEVHYDLAIITYDPVERLRSGAIEAVDVLSSFKRGAP